MNILPCCALTGDGLSQGLDWLGERIEAKIKSKKKKADDGRGLHVTKMPENENKANLSELTIRTSQFAMSERNPNDMSIEKQMDEETNGYDLKRKI